MTSNAYLPDIGLAGGEHLEPGRRYRTASGMGGSFDVTLLSLTPESGATVRVDEPRNPDWNGYTFCVPPDALGPIPRLWQVRTRIGAITGQDDDFMSWGKYPTRAEAETGAKAAGAYIACHPIAIVEVDG
jgi:hypothetical protein